MDKATLRKVEDTLKKFAEVTGKTVEDGIREISSSTAKSLAISMQPYGMNDNIGKRFESNIAKQVDSAWFGTNLGAYPQTSDMQQAHNNARVNGVVPIRSFRKEKGKPWLDLISVSDRNSYKKKQMAKAGRAKAAWIRCGNEIYTKRKISKVPQWVSRHVNNAYGSTSESGEGLKYKVIMTNHTPYLTNRMQSDRSVAKALADSMKNGLKRIQKIIDKEIEKANK
jgi:hypothetical protein